MLFRQLYDAETSTYTYLLADPATRDAVLIDPVLEQVERDLTLLQELGLTLRYVLDTHVHADHVTASGTLKERTGAETVLSERAGSGVADRLVKHGDVIRFGSAELEVRETPGHTDGCLSYVCHQAGWVFTGDALLIRGTGRTDFQQGSPEVLWRSIHEQLFTLPDSTLVYPGHDYRGRTASSIGEEKAHNPRVGGGRTLQDFVRIMNELKLGPPKKLDVAVPANLLSGVPAGLRVTGEEPPATTWAPIRVSAGGIPEVEPEWVAAKAGTMAVVDVREADELVGELGHVPGVRHVPLASVTQAAATWDRDAPVVLLCRSGGRSGKAALELGRMGFRRVASMRGGMTLWNQRRLPVERTPLSG